MIIGIGTDIIEIERIQKAVEKNKRFLDRNFTQMERDLFESRAMSPHAIATNFALKEAVSKALGTGFRGFQLSDVEVLRDLAGKPTIHLYRGAHERFKAIGGQYIHATSSHDKKQAIAYCIVEGEII